MIYGIEASDNATITAPVPVLANFMAVGGQNNQTAPLVATSLDGSNWHSKVSAAAISMASELPVLLGIANNGTRWVAVGYSTLTTNTIIYTSDDDGDTWVQRTGDPSTNVQLNCITWTGTSFIAAGQSLGSPNPIIMKSSDGATWTQKTANPTTGIILSGIGSSASLVVACGTDSATQTHPKIMTSADDGESWSARTPDNAAIGSTVFWSSVVGPSLSVIGGVSNQAAIQTSATGTTWAGHGGTTNEYKALAWNGTKFIGAGADSASEAVPLVATSSDGSTWADKTSDPSAPGGGLEWFGLCGRLSDGLAVAVGFESDFNTPHAMTSVDNGDTWAAVTFDPATNCNPFAIACKQI